MKVPPLIVDSNERGQMITMFNLHDLPRNTQKDYMLAAHRGMEGRYLRLCRIGGFIRTSPFGQDKRKAHKIGM